MITIVHATTEEHYEDARNLFVEYADSLGFDLEFQDFSRELASLPGQYAPPQGCILLAKDSEQAIGCVALRPLEDGICEMKRLYMIPAYRGRGIGRDLARRVINEARERGYKKMRLDTIASMKEARMLYSSLGFYAIEPYRYNPIKDTAYMELDLEALS
jgi:ribosomal protein S18 acetylase RimI-like enzyme